MAELAKQSEPHGLQLLIVGLTRSIYSLPFEVLDALERDNEYLQEGGVFTDDLITTWIDYKKANFVHADMSPDEMAKSMKDRGESIWTIMLRMMAA